MTISGERTEQLDIFCRITGFTSDFLSFIDVELIWFFHGAFNYLIGNRNYNCISVSNLQRLQMRIKYKANSVLSKIHNQIC